MQPSTRIAKVLDKPTGTRITHGTVEDVQSDKVSVLVDNAAAPETLNRACICSMGDRVIVVGNDAVATVGAYGGGGGGSIAPTSSVLKGDGSGNAVAAVSGTDYVAPSSLATVATSGDYDDLLNKPTIPAAQVQSDWNEADNTKADYIKNKPSLATVATSGSYTDLTDKPSIPAAGLPTGGSSGQVLAKSSNADYAVGWVNQSGGGGGSIASTNGLLAGDGTGNAIAADLSALFVLEQYVVINGVSTANNGVAENTVTESKVGYYPLAIAGWTSNNRYPNVYGCRLTAQSVGSASIFCGASNFSGSTRTLTVSAVVLWVKVS